MPINRLTSKNDLPHFEQSNGTPLIPHTVASDISTFLASGLEMFPGLQNREGNSHPEDRIGQFRGKRNMRTSFSDTMQDAKGLSTSDANQPSSSRDPLIGTVLLKRYEVQDLVGTGRFSVVYKARQLLMNRIVAIKSLKRDLLDEQEVVARFEKEARALSRLKHPNIVSVYDCFVSQNGRPYLVMDFLQGMSLEELLAKDGYLTPEMAKPIFTQVCDGLSHAHKHGVLHRDLKPGNMVLLAETKGTELVQLVDFGLAQVEEEVQKLTADGECCGSPAYMSPEHCTGGKIDERSEVYSLGIVMYETLAGVVPFKGRTSVETMRLQIYEDAPPFSLVRPDITIPVEVEGTLLRCLEKEPTKRFKTMQELKEAIMEWGTPDGERRWSKLAEQHRKFSPGGDVSDSVTNLHATPAEVSKHGMSSELAWIGSSREKGTATSHDVPRTTDKLRTWERKPGGMPVTTIAIVVAGLMIAAGALAIFLSPHKDGPDPNKVSDVEPRPPVSTANATAQTRPAAVSGKPAPHKVAPNEKEVRDANSTYETLGQFNGISKSHKGGGLSVDEDGDNRSVLQLKPILGTKSPIEEKKPVNDQLSGEKKPIAQTKPSPSPLPNTPVKPQPIASIATPTAKPSVNTKTPPAQSKAAAPDRAAEKPVAAKEIAHSVKPANRTEPVITGIGVGIEKPSIRPTSVGDPALSTPNPGQPSKPPIAKPTIKTSTKPKSVPAKAVKPVVVKHAKITRQHKTTAPAEPAVTATPEQVPHRRRAYQTYSGD